MAPNRAILACVLALCLAGCGRKDAPATAGAAAPAASASAEQAAAVADATEAKAHLPPGIDWFAGDVEAAFAAAKRDDKPLFLYWGAEWCPPCAQIKSTIFNRREFQERSRLFVPLFLDGDTPSAQQHGERFGVIGYPTMILFRPDGTEITRLPGGVDVARYATILDIALADSRPVGEIIAAARRGETISDNDWRLLAYYAWGADNGRVLPDADAAATFATLVERCPAALPEECARLFFMQLAIAASESPDEPAFSDAQRAVARTGLLALLEAPAIVKANISSLLYGPSEVIGALSSAGSKERTQLIEAWRAALDRLDAEPGVLSPPEQLGLVRSRVLLAKLEQPEGPLPEPLLQAARARVNAIDQQVKDGYARHAAINAAAGLMWEAGLDEDANRLLTSELERSASPYYFMLDLADLAQRAGREDDAIGWLQRAYQTSKGPATRFQWGYNYLVGLIEMKPEDSAAIERAGLAVLGELDGAPDAFHQRTQMRLAQLSTQLLEWGQGDGRSAVINSLRERNGRICSGLPEADEGRRNCERFLTPASAG